jgi:molybdopterin-containing oxidoreductase family iron-sulfur binding subunit
MAADHRLAVRGSDVAAIAGGVLAELGALDAHGLGAIAARYRRGAEGHAMWVKAVARDLGRRHAATLTTAGPTQPLEVHTLAFAIDAATGGLGVTSSFGPSPLVSTETTHDLAPLAAALDAGEVELLVIVDDDVVHASPGFASSLARAASSLYFGSHHDATAAACTWTAPQAHALESWGDTRAFDGTTSIIQPLIAPLRKGRTAIELVEMLLGKAAPDGHALVRTSWKETWSLDGDAFERRWEEALARGVIDGSTAAPVKVPFSWEAVGRVLTGHSPRIAPKEAPLELVFPRDPRMHEGQQQGNAWLLEMPHPVTKLTWENAVEVSPATAERLGVTMGDVAEIVSDARWVEAPIVIVPGIAEGVAALATGWGRTIDGEAVGTNAFGLGKSAHLRKVAGKRRDLPLSQLQHEIPSDEREHAVFRRADVTAHRAHPKEIGKKRSLPKLYQNAPDGEHQWAMTIDLGACTGCSACVVACMAENNVPVVGSEGVIKGRGMHWLRIDTYQLAGSETYTPQPMLCQHCEMAPCEYVCPVNATVHSSDGLNEMVYNRCVGTRFCSNNCPYKVRRFNWFDYHASDPPLVQMVRNPDVTVRARGVMEKCSFCVQRIREVEVRKRAAREPIADGDIVTACQQACPTRAIVFGDQADPRSKVSALLESPRAYGALEDLGTRPRVRYLARIRNRNEELP